MNANSYNKTGINNGVFVLTARFARANLRFALALTCSVGFSAAVSSAEEPAAANLDCWLSTLSQHASLSMPNADVAGVHGQIAKVADSDKALIRGRFDDQDRVLVHVMLDGQSSVDEVAAQIESLQGQVLDRNANFRHGILAAYVPTDELKNASVIKGVRALTMEAPPIARGKFSSQSRAILQTDKLNKEGLNGDGITVGVLSDSFNTAQYGTPPPATTAPQDEKRGYLPQVNVLQDFGGPGSPGTDEGRAICQIVYAEAPHINEAFATAFISEVGFANNIVALRTQAGCSVIDDDVGYSDEPVFSDGYVAQAVNTVVTSTTIPGKPAIYTSSAGNEGNNGYRSSYRNLSDAAVRAGNHGNLNLTKVPSSLTAGGWHNWNPNGGFEPSTTVMAPGPTTFPYMLFLQWDDPFFEDHGITTNYNFLVFDADGNYHPELSGTSNAFKTTEAYQQTANLALGTTYQIAITASKQTDPSAPKPPASHQLAILTFLDGASQLYGKYFQPAPLTLPNIFGHPAAESAIAVAAYAFNWRASLPYLPQLENFTSPGPSIIYFDQNNNRLATPQTRLKPEVAGVDGVLTTFFGAPYYNYPFAFFGTSAAGPTVAGVVALMLQEGGGPGSLSLDTVRTALENSAGPRNATPEVTQALGSISGGYVAVTALAQSYFGPTYLTLNYFGPAGQSIDTLTIDGSKPGLTFNTKEFALGPTIGITSSDVTVQKPSKATPAFTLKFKKGVFTSGASISFTIGQDVAGTFTGFTQDQFGIGCESEDLSYGATFTATLSGTTGKTVTAPFLLGEAGNTLVTGYNPVDGFGLINAVAAVQAITPPAAKPATENQLSSK
jgi:subtilase family protein